MFRPMRRSRQQLSREECEQILEEGKTGVLGVLGDDGYPYTVPVNYVYTGGKIFLHGAKQGHRVDAIRRWDRVSFCVIAEDRVVEEELTAYFRSVILFGRARILEDEDAIRQTAEALGRKYCRDPELVEREIQREWKSLCCVEIIVDHMTGKEAIELTRQRECPGRGQDPGGTI